MSQQSDNVIPFKAITDENNASASSLADILKRVDDFYQSMSRVIPNFVKRESQKDIINACAKVIFEEKLLVAQAGTGIGKTLSYLIGALDSVLQNNDKLIISTNTIALQTQLLEKDLPLIISHLAPQLSYQVAKGSGRYLCPVRAQQHLQKNATSINDKTNKKKLSEPQIHRIKKIYQSFESGTFSGDLDTLPNFFDNSILPHINRDSKLCFKRVRCDEGESCPFYVQRDAVKAADIIITNHALLSQTVLNDHNTFSTTNESEQNSILVIDESHRFPGVLREASGLTLSLEKADKWLMHPTQLLNLNNKLLDHFASEDNWIIEKNINLLETIKALSLDARKAIKTLNSYLQANFQRLSDNCKAYNDEQLWVLSPDKNEPSLDNVLTYVADFFMVLDATLKKLCHHNSAHTEQASYLNQATKNNDFKEFLLLLSNYSQEVSNATACLRIYIEFANIDTVQGKVDSGLARWIQKDLSQQGAFILNANRVNVGGVFQDKFLSSFKSIILTSATIETLGSLDYFINALQINKTSSKNIIRTFQSPFDYSHVHIHYPTIFSDPNKDEHALVIVRQLTKIISRHKTVLVLFSSKRQLMLTFNACSKELQSLIICQDELSKSELLSTHKRRVDSGRASILFGVEGLSEGVDLKGDYLTCVVIAKLPFINLQEPMYAYESSCLKAKGLSDFNLLTLPICSQKLIQSVGRLVRSESDRGEVFILDHRIRSKQYGYRLLESLPMYQAPESHASSSNVPKPNTVYDNNNEVDSHSSEDQKINMSRVKNTFSVKNQDEIE